MPIKLANNASGTLATAISASDTGIALTTGDGAEFPTLGAGDYFYATITSSGGTQEIVKATARSGDSLTIVRAQEGTTALGFPVGSRVELRVTAASVNDRVDEAELLTTTLQSGLAAATGASLVGFLQAGTSAVARTTQAKLRETVSVKDFGAVGDGVMDDTAAIQAAAIAASGAKLFFPEGTYIGQNIPLPADIQLFGNATLKLKAEASLTFEPYFRLTGANVSFDGLTFDGNRANQPADGFSDAWNTGSNGTGKSNRSSILADNYLTGYSIENITIKNCAFINNWSAPVATRDISNILLHGNRFENNNFEGIFAYASDTVQNSGLRISDNLCINIGSGDPSVNANAFLARRYDGVTFAGNEVYTVERNIIKFEVCNNVTATGNVLDTNTVAGFNCFQFQGPTNRATVTGNVFRNVQRGIHGELGTDVMNDITISGNVLEMANVATGNPDGISIISGSNLTITNNTLKNCCRHGIFVRNVNNVIISGNNIAPDATGVNPQIGIYVNFTRDMNDVVVVNNIVEQGFNEGSASGEGALVLAGSGFTLTNAVVSGNIVKTNTGAATERGIRAVNGTFSNVMLRDNYTNGIIECASSVIGLNNLAARNIPGNAFGQVIGFGSSAPASGTHYVGEVQLHSAPAASGNIGWVCTTSGSPGTWKTFGAIAA
jgi:polygalacturonase